MRGSCQAVIVSHFCTFPPFTELSLFLSVFLSLSSILLSPKLIPWRRLPLLLSQIIVMLSHRPPFSIVPLHQWKNGLLHPPQKQSLWYTISLARCEGFHHGLKWAFGNFFSNFWDFTMVSSEGWRFHQGITVCQSWPPAHLSAILFLHSLPCHDCGANKSIFCFSLLIRLS